MTINASIDNCLDLMLHQAAVADANHKSKLSNVIDRCMHSNETSGQQLPSIVISSSTLRTNEQSRPDATEGKQCVSMNHYSSDNATSNQTVDDDQRHHRHKSRMNRSLEESNCSSSSSHNSNNNVTVSVCIEVLDDNGSPDDLANESVLQCTITRPNTLTTGVEPPEFSISPAESLSRPSSSNDEHINQSSSGIAANDGVFLPPNTPNKHGTIPHSSSSLSVNFCYGNNTNGANPMVLSQSFTSLHGSLASSINDLTAEIEQFERAIRHNDVKFVGKILEQYLGKTKVEERSSQQLQCDSKQSSSERTNRPILTAQQAFDENRPNTNEIHDLDEGDDEVRRQSGSTEERECPILTNALHLAIENNAYDVTILLLKNGINPNESGVPPYATIDNWRRNSNTSDESANLPHHHHHHHHNQQSIQKLGGNLHLPSSMTASREPLIRTPSIRTTNSPMLLSPLTGGTQHFFSSTPQPHGQLYYSVNSSPSSINSDLSSIGLHSTPIRLIRCRSEMCPPQSVVYKRADGTVVNYETEYNRQRLFTLPPIYLAVALNNSAIIRELIRYGANVNAVDSHGVTPLHLCLCQEHISRACLQLLVQSGAKMKAKNDQSIAPFELVDHELVDEVLYLQKFIIDDSFGSLLPGSREHRTTTKLVNKKDMLMYANYKSIERTVQIQCDDNSNTSSSVNNLTFAPTSTTNRWINMEESVDSCSSGGGGGGGGGGMNVTRTSEAPKSSTSSGGGAGGDTPVQKRKVHIDLNRSKCKESQISNDDHSDQQPSTSENDYGTGTSLFLPNTISNFMGHKRSFACDSTSTSKTSTNNFSQSTQHLASSKDHQTTKNVSTNSAQQFSSVMGARLFGRRRSGDESIKIKQSAKLATLSRVNTQDEAKMAEENFAQCVENSMDVLCQMSCNIECIQLIISSLRRHLPEIISLNESQNTLLRLHCGLSRLFNRSLQTIVDNFVQSVDQPSPCDTSKSARSQLELRKEMSKQLCGLLVCALQCLKGGQTFQYSSLLIVNFIIDSFTRFELCNIPFDMNNWIDSSGSHRNSTIANLDQVGYRSNLSEKGEKSASHSAISAAANIGKHFRNLRINDSFNFKQNFSKEDNSNNKNRQQQTTTVLDNNSLKNNNRKHNKSDHNRLISWMKQVHLSPKLNQRKHGNELYSNNIKIQNNGKISIDDNGILSSDAAETSNATMPTMFGERQNSTYHDHGTVGETKTAISILIHEGLDLILNVLNNAITLHRRVSGSKQSCTPSKRSRQCIYHCLQILSARAILYGSQCDEAQRRLIKEGPLKVLVASIDSTHDPQLICLALQIIANLSMNPCHHAKLIDADLADCLMQLILPSDEWFYTNHSTKYAKFVKHHAARIMVYLGLEKRLRNKVYLFDLMEDLGVHSPQNDSVEDSYIMQTSVAPSAIYSQQFPTLLIGSSVEAIILDLIKQVEDKIVNGEESLCIDPLNDETYFIENDVDTRTIRDPPAIQVDMPSGIIGDRRITNQHPNCFFYLSTLPMSLQPIVILRVLQHRMFGCFAYWAWHSNAVSRASVASAGGSSIEFNRSRASSNASNANFEISNAFGLKRNINLHCSNVSLSPGRIESERHPSLKGMMDNRLTLQNSLPIGSGTLPKGVHMSNSLSTIGQNNASPYGNKLPVQLPTFQRLSLIEHLHQHHQHQHMDSPTAESAIFAPNRRYRFSSLRRSRHSLSTDNANVSPTRNNSLDASERNEAYILAFQRELQNLPKTESPSPMFGNGVQTMLTHSLASIIRDAFERTGTPLKRPRSCSVPRITLENFSSTLLQLPGANNNNSIDSNKSQIMMCSISPLIRSATSDVSCSNIAHTMNSGPSTSLSPIKATTTTTARNHNESPISYNSTCRTNSRSGSRSGSAGQVMTETIVPNVHKAILRLLLDWVSLCPNDFQQNPSRRELVDFLNRVSLLGENYRWLVDEIRLQAHINEKENMIETPSNDSQLNKEYKMLQKLILSGELPCPKDEAAKLAVFQQRIEEISPRLKENESGRHIVGSVMLPNVALRQNSIIEEKLRPICEDVKETSTIDCGAPLRISSLNMSSNSFDELEEDEQDELEIIKLDHGRPSLSGTSRHGIIGHRLQAGQFGEYTHHINHHYNLSSSNSSSPAPGAGNVSNSGNFIPSLTKRTTSRLCHWVSSNWSNRQSAESFSSSIDVRECLPPMYHNTKSIVKAIKEQKRKLFHTPAYDSELQLKKLYVHTCKRLPAFGCRIFQVKELLHGKTNRRATRLLGICLERIVLLDSKTLQQQKVQPVSNLQQWRTGGGRSHDRLVLEFRGSKWSFVAPSNGSLRAIGTVLWEIMQDIDACFLDTLIAGERIASSTSNSTTAAAAVAASAGNGGGGYGAGSNVSSMEGGPRVDDGVDKQTNKANSGGGGGNSIDYYGFGKTMHFRDELQRLEMLLHFPEEVAHRLTDIEHELFYNIEPVHYIRQVTVELNPPNDPRSNDSARMNKSLTVKELIERFNEVSSWITHIIISQPTHEMRKAILSCIMRVVQTCWNLGNFNSAVEILAGLKSEKLKPFWLSIEQKDEPFLRKELSHILLTLDEPSPEYKSAVIRALDIPHSKTIPFFGAFLRDLKTILQRVPSLIVLCTEQNWKQSLQTSSLNCRPMKPLVTKIDSISEFNGEDNYMSRIGVGGIINLEKMYKTHQVLDNIRTFHIHAIRRSQLLSEMKCTANNVTCVIEQDDHGNNRYYQLYCDQQFFESELGGKIMRNEYKQRANSSSIEEQCQQTSRPSTNSSQQKLEKDHLYNMELNSFKPIQRLTKSHGISIIPLETRSIDFHTLQAMHHGMSTIHYEEDTGRSSVVYLQLEQSNSTLAWCKPYWSTSLRSSGNTPQDYQLSLDIEKTILAGIMMKYEMKESALIALDDGFLDLMYLKDIVVGQSNVDPSVIARRHNLPDYVLTENGHCSIKLLFGTNLNDNRTTEFIAPKYIASLWIDGLRSVHRLIQKQKKLCDQRMLWLKEKYLQLYYEEGACTGPTPAEAIRVFGGRKWTIESMGASHQSLQMDPLTTKTMANSNKLRKKKSTVSLSVIRDYGTRSQLSINSDPEANQNNVQQQQSRFGSPQQSYKSPKLMNKRTEMFVESVYNSQSSLSNKSTSSGEGISKGNVLDYSPIHTTVLTSNYREKFCKRAQPNIFDSFGSNKSGSVGSPRKSVGNQSQHTPKHRTHANAITHSSNMDFMEFSDLFRSFLICIRRDIKDIFEQIASKSDIHTFLEAESNYIEEKSNKHESKSFKSKTNSDARYTGLLTRNTNIDMSEEDFHKSRIFDAIARASIVTNSAGINTLKTSVLTATDFYAFITTYQCEKITLDEVKRLIQLHEPNPVLQKRECLSFEGFARYLMDKDNFGYTPELQQVCEEEMDYPLSHYYMASSHNTYLTGHQLKGESSVELYSQVLLTGCRCVELDCWDGDDGMPLIYHGHTLTSKIPFKKVVETINEKAFVASPYPVILSVENHCSLQQQVRMAQIFQSVFGEKLVTKFLFESDFSDEPQLPTPNQLKYRILIKNKKLRAPMHPSLNLKLRSNMQSFNKGSNGRTNSLVSNVSTGSLNDEDDDEYEDEDEDDEVDESGLIDGKGNEENEVTVKKTSNASGSKIRSHTNTDSSHHSSLETESHLTNNSPYVQSKVVRKSSSQIAPELSDLVIYCQAIKFRGIIGNNSNLSPTSSAIATPISKTKATRKALTSATFNSTITAASLLPVIESNKIRDELRDLSTPSPTFTHNFGSPINTNVTANKRANSSAACYQISSINENTAKKLCRKTPLAVIAHTESQIMRTYPAGMRIDSSNFNPVIFWAFGIQSVALNYQTVDTALHINSAMFEQNGGCGYVPKTSVMRDKSHLMFGRFNPYDKEFDGLHTINLTITIISGQYACPNTNTGSPQVEVEIIGIPVDNCRQRTKIVQRNSLNPIWNDNFSFRIKFVDLAFIRITVTDVGANHLAAQRIIPVKCLKQGYRHIRLRGPQNQSLPLSTLFIYTSYEEEGLDMESESSADKMKLKNKMLSKIELNRLDANRIDISGTAPVKRRMFFLMVHGVMPEEPSTILKITQESTVTDVITQALTKANKSQENVNDFFLVEEVSRGWEKKKIGNRNSQVTQRLLEPNERPLEAQSNWKGDGRFILKKIADDPSTRAWMTSIRSSSANKERQEKRQDQNYVPSEEIVAGWEDEPENETFLVCIYNVSHDQPYTILKASNASTAQDIITQALLKAHRDEEPKLFVIIEEVDNFIENNSNDLASSFSFKSKQGNGYRRVLGDHENIYVVQTQWKNKGKFEMKYRKDVTSNDNTYMKCSSPSSSKLLRSRGSLKKLSQLHRTYSKRLSQRRDGAESPGSGGSVSRKSSVNVIANKKPQTPETPPNNEETESKSMIKTGADSNNETRNIHSEGEILSDSEERPPTKEPVRSFTRLKKLSLKRLKVWKS